MIKTFFKHLAVTFFGALAAMGVMVMVVNLLNKAYQLYGDPGMLIVFFFLGALVYAGIMTFLTMLEQRASKR